MSCEVILDMPEEEYHALDRLSASGIVRLRAGPLDYWYYTYGPGCKEESTAAQIEGTAKHAGGLEGLDAFMERYQRALTKEEFACEILDSQEDLKQWCRDHGILVSGSKAVLCDRISEACDATGETPPILWMRVKEKEAEEAESKGREILKPDVYDDAVSRSEVISSIMSPAREAGGIPEVTILYDLNGIECKARIDFLEPGGIWDLKNIANKSGGRFADVCHREIANRNLPIQAEWYLRAAQIAQDEGALPFAMEKDFSFRWLMVQSSGPANVLIRRYLQFVTDFDTGKFRRSMISGDARATISSAMHAYFEFKKTHGKNRPWEPALDVQDMEEVFYPPWFLLR